MTAIEKMGTVFFLALFCLVAAALAWSFLTESGQAKRERTRVERETSAQLAIARSEKKKLATVEAMNASDAWHACRDFVKPNLGPAETRTWSDSYDAQVVGEYVLDGKNKYRVRGYVDSFSGNPAGDVLRTHIDCAVTEISFGEWVLDDLTLE